MPKWLIKTLVVLGSISVVAFLVCLIFVQMSTATIIFAVEFFITAVAVLCLTNTSINKAKKRKKNLK